MPAYVQGTFLDLQAGVVRKLWDNETPNVGDASQAASLYAYPTKVGMPFGIDLHFNAAPGVFEVDIQVCAIDADGNYTLCSNGQIAAVDANFNAHFDFFGIAKFARLKMVARANAVACTATATGG